MDCYRLEDSDEDLGFDEYFQDEGITENIHQILDLHLNLPNDNSPYDVILNYSLYMIL
jgi:hypothetical protein